MAKLGLKKGTPEIKSVGALAFGPDDVLFVADSVGATITAVDVADPGDASPASAFDLEDLDARLASFLGCDSSDVVFSDLAVHPRTHNIYLSVMRGRGNDGVPVILRLDHRSAAISEVALDGVEYSQVTLDNAPSPDDARQDVRLGGPGEGQEMTFNGKTLYLNRVPVRTSTVTDMAYVDGVLMVAGMSNEEFSSNMRRIPFPFNGAAEDNSLEIFHVSHGQWETAAPIRTFIPTDGGSGILASYTCTPLVYFRTDELINGTKATGRTVAELGAGNQPLDMISFTQSGSEYLLISNSTHPLIKVKTSDIAGAPALTTPKEPTGIPRETIDLPGVSKLANFNGDHVLALQSDATGKRNLRSLKTESL
jgi:hypothetical protein